MKTMQNIQRGFSLVSAIFLLVVIAALDVLGSRAYQASRAGIEWGAYQVLQNGGCPASSQVLAALPNTLANFNVEVDCGNVAVSEASATVTMYQLTSTAKQGTVATPNSVERQMSVTIAK